VSQVVLVGGTTVVPNRIAGSNPDIAKTSSRYLDIFQVAVLQLVSKYIYGGKGLRTIVEAGNGPHYPLRHEMSEDN
jgi:hypothetical protein